MNKNRGYQSNPICGQTLIATLNLKNICVKIIKKIFFKFIVVEKYVFEVNT